MESQLKNRQQYSSAFFVFWREMARDKTTLISMLFVVFLMVFVYAASLFLDQDAMMRINLNAIHEPPSANYILGTDYGGRPIFGQLIIGTRNSITIGLLVTFLSGLIGITFGVTAGYFGGFIDNVMMRILDFFFILPFLMIVIVFVALVPSYGIVTFSLIMTLFSWMGMARLIRSKTLQENELDYVQASKTLGSSHTKIIFGQILPNISSLIIVTLTLNLASNIGLESGLSFLGFGFPESTPSLGTLLGYATNPQTLAYRWWIWLPAAVLILLLMLAVRNIGEALKRASDAKQRR